MNTKTESVTGRVAVALPLILALFCGTTAAQKGKSSGATSQPPAYIRRVTQNRIAVELEVTHQDARNRSAEFLEGEDVILRFKVSDPTTGSPLTNAKPAAWMDPSTAADAADPKACTKKIQLFLSGGIINRPKIDLNVFYVLALNEDATITVVDPLFGYGGTKLLALVQLKRPGDDWALTEDQNRLFVSMPEAGQVAVVDTVSWKVVSNIEAGTSPKRVALQPDEAYLWVANGDGRSSGITVINTQTLEVVARIATGKTAHQIAFDDRNRRAFITNPIDRTVTVVDIRSLRKIKEIQTPGQPVSVAFSSLAQAAYVACDDGVVQRLGMPDGALAGRFSAEPGLTQVRFAPGDRYGFLVNTGKNRVYVFDTSLNRIIHSADVETRPDLVAFSSELAYIRHRDSEDVLMIPLEKVGRAGEPLPLVDFPGGQNPPGRIRKPSSADGIVQVPGESAVLVVNPGDRAIYYYKEGMAAPMGNFSNYGREPRAALMVDRGLREESPGVYRTITRLGGAGAHSVLLFLDQPRLTHCFDFEVKADPHSAARRGRSVEVELAGRLDPVKPGSRVRQKLRLTDGLSKGRLAGLDDVQVLVYTGVWQSREWARPAGEGVYEMEFTPPAAGWYEVHVASSSAGLKHRRVATLEVVE
jgi:YVTN family beta-propeller protein